MFFDNTVSAVKADEYIERKNIMEQQQQRPRKPRSARKRTAPPDARSLETALRSVHADFLMRAKHLKEEPHDYSARRGFQTLYEQRSEFLGKLMVLEPQRYAALMTELGLRWSAIEEVTS